MFHLDFDVPKSPSKICLGDSLVSLGSCFADNIGSRLSDFKFNCLSNPFGVIYNPVSLCEIIDDEIDEDEFVQNQGVFFHWQAHGQVSGLTADDLSVEISKRRKTLRESLEKADWLVITLGSAFAYRLKSTGRLVANCHKVPQSKFDKVLLEIREIQVKLFSTLAKLKELNSRIQVICTVSPVRHIRDGLVENNRGKARLLEVVNNLSWEHDWIKYFPAYEIQIDQLRDYRFYAKDRVHPNDEAVDFIWEKFNETYFDNEALEFVKEWKQIRGMMAHRPIQPNSSEHQKFIGKTIERLESLSKRMDVSKEVSLLKAQLL